MTPLIHVSSMDRFLEALDSLDTAKTSPFGYSFGDILVFERMLVDRAVTLRNTVLLYSFRFLSKMKFCEVRPWSNLGRGFLVDNTCPFHGHMSDYDATRSYCVIARIEMASAAKSTCCCSPSGGIESIH